MALEDWPEWSPMFQMVRLQEPAIGTAGGFMIHGIVGRVPYRSEFIVFDSEPLRHFIFQAVSPSTPFNTLWHDVRLAGPTLTWTIVYSLSAGPGGILVDRLLVRRQATSMLTDQLDALRQRITSGNRVG